MYIVPCGRRADVNVDSKGITREEEKRVSVVRTREERGEDQGTVQSCGVTVTFEERLLEVMLEERRGTTEPISVAMTEVKKVERHMDSKPGPSDITAKVLSSSFKDADR